MKKEFLTELGIDEETAQKIMAQHEEDILELQQANETLTETNKTLTKEAKENQKKYEDDTKKLTDELVGVKYDNAADKYLSQFEFSSGLARDAAKSKFKEKGFALSEDGVFDGADEFMEELKASQPEAFLKKKADPQIITGAGGGSGITKEEFDKMGYNDKLKFFRENPEDFKKFSEEGNE